MDVTIDIGGRTLPVLRPSGEGLIVPLTAGLHGYRGPARVMLAEQNRVWRGDIEVAVDAAGGETRLAFIGGAEGQRRLATVFNWYTGTTGSYAAQFADIPKPSLKTDRRGYRHMAKLVCQGAFALALIVAIFQHTNERATSVVSHMAYVSVPGAELVSNTAGQVTYVKDEGTLSKGEFYAALKTAHNYDKFLEASESGEITTQAVAPDDYVRKGTAVTRLSAKNARPYVAAFVKLTDAVTALNAVRAEIEFTRSGERLSLPISAGSYVNNTRVFTDEDGKSLAEISLRLPDEAAVPMEGPVIVRFQGASWHTSFLPSPWLDAIASLVS